MVKLKCPVLSETVPIFVFLKLMRTPGNPILEPFSYTNPLTEVCCAESNKQNRSEKSDSTTFIISILKITKKVFMIVYCVIFRHVSQQ